MSENGYGVSGEGSLFDSNEHELRFSTGTVAHSGFRKKLELLASESVGTEENASSRFFVRVTCLVHETDIVVAMQSKEQGRASNGLTSWSRSADSSTQLTEPIIVHPDAICDFALWAVVGM